ncbi:uncharacterized protein LOC117109721 [Anneissia japonica]|uniref:uncharacterized protein LOC117109721 n=1 Tax=Anneissia japonica TaxID=1529436 RepID=UPI0014258ABA|nr:uncharacterized protein LOC117109721 [Anneissia japonica]
MELADEAKKVLTIITEKGFHQMNRLPFGITTAPAIWQNVLLNVLQGLNGVQVYLDDDIITGKDDQEHINNLKGVLSRLEEYGLKLRRDKCVLMQKFVAFLCHVIDKDGIHKCPIKTEQILNIPLPTDVTDNKPLTQIFGPKTGLPVLAAERMQRWALYISGFDYEIVFRNSGANANVDCVSRLPIGSAPENELTDVNVNLIEAMKTLPSPARVFMSRPLRSRLDMLRPSMTDPVRGKLHDQMQKCKSKIRTFEVDDKVFVRDFRGREPNKIKWTTKKLGPLCYEVKVSDK